MAEIMFDDGPYPRARLGFICVANAGLTEGDMFTMRPEGVGLSFSRVRMNTECTIENLAQMEHDLEEALEAFAPARPDLDVICYNCTSGSFVIGEDKVCRMIEHGRDGVRATTLLTGVVAALKAVGATKVAIGTAYTQDIDALEREYFEARGFSLTDLQGLGLMTDVEMNQVSPGYLREFALSLDRRGADAIFLSCGALRSLEIVAELEALTGLPVICSNQASFWHCLRLTGINDRLAGFGRLFQEC